MSLPADYAFLHGGAQGGWIWEEAIAALQLQGGGTLGRALALDVPGCGTKRDQNTASITADETADELLADLTRAGMSDVLLIGHSQAGSIMPLMVERQPELFRRLVYVSCSAPLPGQNVVQMMGTGKHGSNPDEVGWPYDPTEGSRREQYPAMFCNDMSAEQAAILLDKLGRDMWPEQVTFGTGWRYDHLGAVPSSYVLCLRDGILPPLWQEEFARRLQVDDLVRIDAGHQVMNSRPHALAEVLRLEAARPAA